MRPLRTEQILELAESGNVPAMLVAGDTYSRGASGVPRDAAKAEAWMQRAAEKDSAEVCRAARRHAPRRARDPRGACMLQAQWWLGMVALERSQQRGADVAKEQGRAVEWCAPNSKGRESSASTAACSRPAGRFLKAEDRDFPPALRCLAFCYRNGIGVPPDPTRSFELYQRAATLGYPAAQYQLGNCFESGLGTACDEKSARVWYRKAAEAGLPEAQFEMGVHCWADYGRTREAKAAAEAIRWTWKGSQSGHAPALRQLGAMLASVPRDAWPEDLDADALKSAQEAVASEKRRIWRKTLFGLAAQLAAWLFVLILSGGLAPLLGMSVPSAAYAVLVAFVIVLNYGSILMLCGRGETPEEEARRALKDKVD